MHAARLYTRQQTVSGLAMATDRVAVHHSNRLSGYTMATDCVGARHGDRPCRGTPLQQTVSGYTMATDHVGVHHSNRLCRSTPQQQTVGVHYGNRLCRGTPWQQTVGVHHGNRLCRGTPWQQTVSVYTVTDCRGKPWQQTIRVHHCNRPLLLGYSWRQTVHRGTPRQRTMATDCVRVHHGNEPWRQTVSGYTGTLVYGMLWQSYNSTIKYHITDKTQYNTGLAATET